MTSVRFCRDSRGRLCGFTVLGHTGSAPEGEDIVCAGVSALTQTAVNALETVAHAPASVIVRSGFLSVRLHKGLSARQQYAARIILRSVRQGLEDIAEAYPAHLKVSE